REVVAGQQRAALGRDVLGALDGGPEEQVQQRAEEHPFHQPVQHREPRLPFCPAPVRRTSLRRPRFLAQSRDTRMPEHVTPAAVTATTMSSRYITSKERSRPRSRKSRWIADQPD